MHRGGCEGAGDLVEEVSIGQGRELSFGESEEGVSDGLDHC